MINDKELRLYFRELFYLCENFFNNTYEKRFVVLILDKIKQIETYVSENLSNDIYLKELMLEFSKLDNIKPDKLPKSIKENFLTGIIFIFIFPFFLGRVLFTESSNIDQLRKNLEYTDKKREKERNVIVSKIASISRLSIEALNEV